MAEEEPPLKRPRHENDRLVVLDLLACVGDRAKDFDSVCEQISAVVEPLQDRLLAPEGSREAFDSIGNALLRCGTELPFKAGVYATIAGLITSGDLPCGKQFAQTLGFSVCRELSTSIRDGKAAKAKRALGFLAELANVSVISPSYLASTLCTILSSAAAEISQPSRGANNVHARGHFLADIALSTLLWCGETLSQNATEEMALLLESVDSISDNWIPNRWRAIAVGDHSLAVESFSELLPAISVLRSQAWSRSSEVAPAYHTVFSEQLKSVPSVSLEPFKLPSHSKLTRYAPPRFRLCLLSDAETDSIPADSHLLTEAAEIPSDNAADLDGSVDMKAETENDSVPNDSATANGEGRNDHSSQTNSLAVVDRCIRRQYVTDILDNFAEDHVKAAERLLTLPTLLGANDIVVETLFTEMCAIPMPSNPEIYYGTVFVDLCKVKDSRLPIKLLAAVEKIFQDSGCLDPEVFDRLSEWFSFHLSNFGYQWNWADWAVYADNDMVERFPFRSLFCRDVLDRSVRLSYYERIRKIIPDDMAFFLPPVRDSGNTVRFSQELTEKLVKIVAGEGKQPPDVVRDRLTEMLPSSQFDEDESESNLARLVALVRAILKGSSRTLSHFDTLAERYLVLLSTMSSSGGVSARKAITLEVGTFWASSHLKCLYILDKLSTYRVIDGLAILDYIFSDATVNAEGELTSMAPLEICKRLEQSALWQLCRLVYHRAKSRLDGARLELTAASEAASHAAEGDAEQAETRLERAKSGSQNAKMETRQLVLLGLRRLFGLTDIVFSDQEKAASDTAQQDESQNCWKSSNGKIFSWRALGMIREIARKHPEQVEALLEDVKVETSDARARHPALQESFEVLEEIAGCDIHFSVC